MKKKLPIFKDIQCKSYFTSMTESKSGNSEFVNFSISKIREIKKKKTFQ